MYLVKIYTGPNDNEGIVVHSPYVSGVKLISPSVDLDIKDISSMTFTVNFASPAWNKIRPLQTLVRVYRVSDNKKMFDGRVLTPTQNMSSDGMFSVDYVCEDRKAYLHDSAQRHGEYRDMTVRQFLGVILDNHNAQVEAHKRFKLGNVTVTNSTDNVYRYLGYESTFDTIKDKLTNRLGGYIFIRDEPDGMYLDYLESVGEVKATPIRMAYNMQDLKKDIDPTNVITRLVPLGANIESEDTEATDASQARVNISTVNGGKDYLDDTLLIAEFGVIEGSVVWDDINDVGILKTRGLQYLATQKASTVQIDTTAVNVDLITGQEDTFELGNLHPVVNDILAISEPIQIVGMKINLNEPQKFQLKIGEKQQTLSQYQADANKRMKELKELENRVNSLGKSNARLRTSLDAAKQDLTDIQDSLINIDIANLPTELQGIAQQLVGLQDSISSIEQAVADIPVYELATNIKSGLMYYEDKAKLDLIVATQLVDLDNLVSRVEALETPPEPTP